MINKVTLIVLTLQMSLTTWAGFLPPPDDPYWCYEACIDPNYRKHNECVKKCYPGESQSANSDLNSKTSACTDFNTQTRIAREAVKSLIALADVPPVETYYGGVEKNQDGFMVVNVQPQFKLKKDWYKVTIRNSDCRVIDTNLFRENLPLE